MARNTKRDHESGVAISLEIPAQNPDLFGSKATDDLLVFLSRSREDVFTVRELSAETDHSRTTVSRAVDVLSDNDLVVERREGNRRLVGINREQLSVPDDPLVRIPQQEFWKPVEAAVDALTDELDGVIAVVLYGSVSRGDADRRSDIDLWVLVDDDRPANQRRANRVKNDLEEQTFDGNRYGYDVDVEVLSSVPRYSSEIRTIVLEGIPIYDTSKFESVRKMLVHGEGDA